MARRYDSADAKRRVLAACARLFLEKGYTNTRVRDILKASDVSAGSFQNLFRAKDGVLTEFVGIMFRRQFAMAQELTAGAATPVQIYAVETALQLALTELDENLRDVNVEAYTYPAAVEIIHRYTAGELQNAFGEYLPGFTEGDFYETEVGTAGMMRSFMAHRCDPYFTLDRKIRCFLEMSLSAFHVPQEERVQLIAYAAGMELRAAAKSTMDALFRSLSMGLKGSLDGNMTFME